MCGVAAGDSEADGRALPGVGRGGGRGGKQLQAGIREAENHPRAATGLHGEAAGIGGAAAVVEDEEVAAAREIDGLLDAVV